jgi:hypothetical protein
MKGRDGENLSSRRVGRNKEVPLANLAKRDEACYQK